MTDSLGEAGQGAVAPFKGFKSAGQGRWLDKEQSWPWTLLNHLDAGIGCKSLCSSDFDGFGKLITFKHVMIILIIMTWYKLL
jgi:hypothetical protein